MNDELRGTPKASVKRTLVAPGGFLPLPDHALVQRLYLVAVLPRTVTVGRPCLPTTTECHNNSLDKNNLCWARANVKIPLWVLQTSSKSHILASSYQMAYHCPIVQTLLLLYIWNLKDASNAFSQSQQFVREPAGCPLSDSLKGNKMRFAPDALRSYAYFLCGGFNSFWQLSIRAFVNNYFLRSFHLADAYGPTKLYQHVPVLQDERSLLQREGLLF